MAELYAVEWNGDCWQSVFPSYESELSQLHTDIDDACRYIWEKKPGISIIVFARS